MSDHHTTEPSEDTAAGKLLTQCMHALSNDDTQTAARLIAQRDRLAGVDGESLHIQSLIQFRQRDVDKAIELVEQAIALTPGNDRFLHSYASFISSAGRFAEAQRILVKLIAEDPTRTVAFNTLAGIRQFQPDDDVLWIMEKNVVGRPLAKNKAAELCFGLAKAYDDLGEYDKAWQAITQGNALVTMEDTTAYFAQGVRRSKAVFTADFIRQRRQMGHQSRAPIFVVGLPRSGTTLTEKILSEHMDVCATGELTALGQIGSMMADDAKVDASAGQADAMDKAVPEQIYGAARGYLDYAHQNIHQWSERFVDKMPDNSFNLGLAACLFPNARFVHVMRHPLDIILSIYFRKFGKVRYAFDIDRILAHYRAYQDVMAHWRQVLPQGQLIEVRYENIVDDKDRARDMLLGKIIPPTEHRPAVDAGTQDNNKIMTASRWQVRQPIYTTSKGKWRNYETQLARVIDAMGGMAKVEAEVVAQETRCILGGAGNDN